MPRKVSPEPSFTSSKLSPRYTSCETAKAPGRQLKVTQVRSPIGGPRVQRETLRSLGLKRLHDVVVKEDRPEIRGMVNAVSHLVTVEEVD